MKIINIEAHAFETMMKTFDSFTKKVESICRRNADKSLHDWLDNQDACLILNISKRSLQTYRDNGILSYTQIGHKMYYRSEDIIKILPFVTQKEKAKSDKKRRNYGGK